MRPNLPQAVLRERVDMSGGPDACWPWIGQRSPRGYGRVVISQKHWRAHRLAYVTWIGPLADDLLVCHHCDNPPCCNPAHLFLGAHLDNQRDKWTKGRGVINAAYGESSGAARLTEAKVREMRARYIAGESSLQLAARFGVNKNTIAGAVNGTTWNHIPGSVAMRAASPPALSPEQLAEIRAVPRYWGVNARLARRYGVSAPTIARARGVLQ